MGAFFTRAHVLEKKDILFPCTGGARKQMSFLIVSNENIFSKTQGTRLGAIITPNKGLE